MFPSSIGPLECTSRKTNLLLNSHCWTRGRGRKGPVNYGPFFRPPFHLSNSFLRNGSLVFPETLHGVRGTYGDVCDIAEFFSEKSPSGEMTKNSQKWLLNRVFRLFRKILLLFLSGNGVELKYLWSFNILVLKLG